MISVQACNESPEGHRCLTHGRDIAECCAALLQENLYLRSRVERLLALGEKVADRIEAARVARGLPREVAA